MATTKPDTPLVRYRRRQKQRGIVRVEVQVRAEDTPLVRDVARALTDPERGAAARALLRDRLAPASGKGLKALLATAPLEGIDLVRDRAPAREVDL